MMSGFKDAREGVQTDVHNMKRDLVQTSGEQRVAGMMAVVVVVVGVLAGWGGQVA